MTDGAPTAHEGLRDDIARCVHCGFCLQACPTYLQLGSEADSPRGRIALIDALASGRAPASPPLLRHLDLCLQCRACETACPSGVRFGHIMETARAEVVASHPPVAWRIRAAALRQVLTRPHVMLAAMTLLRAYDRSPLPRLLAQPRVRSAMPAALRRAVAAAPRMPARPFAMPPQPTSARSVAFLSGCVMPHLYPRTHVATVRVLNRLGYRVVEPEAQVCCGALSAHAGDRRTARELARKNIDAFLAAGVEAIVVDSAGCGAAMKEYGELLRDDAEYGDRAARVSEITRDVLEFVVGHELPPLGAVHETVTYQDSCHLVHAQRVTHAPRQLLSAIPGLDLRELVAPDRCCGSAGLYSLVQSEMSGRLLDEKMDDVAATGAHVIATANPGCMMQLEAGARQHGLDARVVHVMELVDESMSAGSAE